MDHRNTQYSQLQGLDSDRGTGKAFTDCYYFMNTGCSKGEHCEFRHSEAAKKNTRLCTTWTQSGSCSKTCMFRHPPLNVVQQAAPSNAMIPCTFFLQGRCTKGNSCPYAHVVNMMGGGPGPNAQAAPAPAEPPVCSYFLQGNCTKGLNCQFRHVYETEASRHNGSAQGNSQKPMGQHAENRRNAVVDKSLKLIDKYRFGNNGPKRGREEAAEKRGQQAKRGQAGKEKQSNGEKRRKQDGNQILAISNDPEMQAKLRARQQRFGMVPKSAGGAAAADSTSSKPNSGGSAAQPVAEGLKEDEEKLRARRERFASKGKSGATATTTVKASGAAAVAPTQAEKSAELATAPAKESTPTKRAAPKAAAKAPATSQPAKGAAASKAAAPQDDDDDLDDDLRELEQFLQDE